MGLSLPELDFTPVPPARRRSPGRVKSVPARLYVDRYAEHREAYEYLQKVQKMYGAGTKTLVRSLLLWKEDVAAPLDDCRTADGRIRVPERLRFALAEFTPISARTDRVKHVSARLYVDKWIEHREAYEFIQRQQRLHGEGNKTIVRAVLYHRDCYQQAKAAR